MNQRSRPWLALVGIVGLALPAAADDGPNAATIERARKSVVQVLCEDGTRAGSGFIYGARSTVVSALHVVAGCDHLKVYFEHHDFERKARVVRALPERDLVMMEVEDSPEIMPLERAADNPTSTQRLQAIGFHESPTMENFEVTVSGGASRLDEVLPRPARQEVERSTKIDVKTPIVRLNPNLLPGFSGGPIINGDGKVAAISAGGMRAGITVTSFAWPASFIDELEASTQPVEQVAAAPPPVLFSVARASDAPTEKARKGMTCGKLEFVREATLSLEEIALTSDDNPIALLVQILASAHKALELVSFDLWVNEESGATIPLPSTVTIESGENWCVAHAKSGPYRVLIRGEGGLPIDVELTPFGETNQASDRFDELLVQEIANRIGQFQFEPDAELTDWMPKERFDGLVSRREAGYAAAPYSNDPPLLVYVTHMARNGTYVGAAAINGAYDLLRVRACADFPSHPECEALREKLVEWLPMMFAASMATYPIQ